VAYKFVSVTVSKMLLEVFDPIFGKGFLKYRKRSQNEKNVKNAKR